jgi:LmbE family N-acetylglucosaminyl deacetylase
VISKGTVAANGRPMPRFKVDGAHLGRSEVAWAASPALAMVPPLGVPPIEHLLVVAPHPDDEVLGAGGLLQIAAAAGARVEICAVTDGEASYGGIASEQLRRLRTAESINALGRLELSGGVRRDRLGVGDGHVAQSETELTEYLADRLGPGSLCVAPWRGDGHPDHDACGRAAAIAAASAGAARLEYLVWAWHWADPLGIDLPWPGCRRLELNRRQVARKRWATAAFHSQTQPAEPGGDAVLPASVLRRFWRPFEVYVA